MLLVVNTRSGLKYFSISILELRLGYHPQLKPGISFLKSIDIFISDVEEHHTNVLSFREAGAHEFIGIFNVVIFVGVKKLRQHIRFC